MSVVALVVGGTLATAPGALAKGSSPTVSFPQAPSVTGSEVSIEYVVNRNGRSVTSQSCTLDDGSTSTAVDCGSLTSGPKTKPAAFAVSLTGLAEGSYTFSVAVTLGDGGRAAATSDPFTVDPRCYQGKPDFIDGRLTGPLGEPNNWTYFLSSTDGTCTGDAEGMSVLPVIGDAVVQAPDRQAALDQCGPLNTNVTAWNEFYPEVPADWYVCTRRGA